MEQRHYWKHGYQVGSEKITGRYYFLLNFATVRVLDSRNYAEESYARHVDVMKDLFDLIDISIANQKNVFVWKARDKAFSYNMTALALGEMMMERNNTVVAMFPKGEEVKFKENFIDKYDTSFNNLPQCMKMYPDLKNTQNELHYGYEDKDDETGQIKIKGANNRIAFLKVSRKDIAKSFRYKIGIIDEAGEIDCLKALVDTNDANTMYGGQRYGIQIVGGTSNAAHAGYADVCFIWDNAEKLGFNKFFIPRNKALWGWVPQYDAKGKELPMAAAINHETGESLVDVAENYFLNKLRILESIGDRNGVLEFKQNYPANEADAFLRVTSSPFPIEEISAQLQYVRSNQDIQSAITRGNIEIIAGTNPIQTKFVPAVNGRWRMFLPPNPALNFPDVIGIDTVKDEEVVDSDSQNAIVVYRPFQSMKEVSGLPVCIYRNRPSSIYAFFHDAVLTCIHYNSMALIEYINNMIFDHFVENNAGRYLAWRPTILTELGSKAQNRWGVKPQSGAAPALSYAIEETKGNISNHVFPELMQELIDFGVKNTDLADAYKWAIMLSKEVMKVKKVEDEKKKQKAKPRAERFLIMKNGHLEVVANKQEFNRQRYGYQ